MLTINFTHVSVIFYNLACDPWISWALVNVLLHTIWVIPLFCCQVYQVSIRPVSCEKPIPFTRNPPYVTSYPPDSNFRSPVWPWPPMNEWTCTATNISRTRKAATSGVPSIGERFKICWISRVFAFRDFIRRVLKIGKTFSHWIISIRIMIC